MFQPVLWLPRAHLEARAWHVALAQALLLESGHHLGLNRRATWRWACLPTEAQGSRKHEKAPGQVRASAGTEGPLHFRNSPGNARPTLPSPRDAAHPCLFAGEPDISV